MSSSDNEHAEQKGDLMSSPSRNVDVEPRKRPRLQGTDFVDMEAEESDEEYNGAASGAQDLSSDEDHDDGRRVLDDELVDDDEIGPKKQRAQLKSTSTAALTEGDYDVLEEAYGVSFRKKKRLRTGAGRIIEHSDDEDDIDADDDDLSSGDEDTIQKGKRRKHNKKVDEDRGRSGGIDFVGEEEDDDDALEEDDEELDDDGFIVGQTSKRDGVRGSGMGAAASIFGDGLGAFLAHNSDRGGGDDSHIDHRVRDDDEEEADHDDDDSGMRRRHRRIGDNDDGADNIGGERRQASLSTKMSIAKLEPALEERYHMRPEDDVIRTADLPERLQIRVVERMLPHDWTPDQIEDAIRAEASWMYRLHLHQTYAAEGDVTLQIVHVLRYIRLKHLEIPYIAMYQREYTDPLREEDMWRIDELDAEWDALQRQAIALQGRADENGQEASLGEGDRDLLSHIVSLEEKEALDDLADYFRFASSNSTNHSLSAAPRRGVLSDDMVVIARQLRPLLEMLGMPPRDIGENLSAAFLTHQPPDPVDDPLTVAAPYVSMLNESTPTHVLAKARMIASRRIGVDPLVRRAVRQLYWQNAVVSSFPTALGKRQIDWLHEYFPVKYITRKPVSLYTLEPSDEFVLLLDAVKNGFVTVEIGPTLVHGQKSIDASDDVDDAIISACLPFVCSPSRDRVVAAWNEERRRVLVDALRQHVYPVVQGQVRAKIIRVASQAIEAACAAQLHEWLSIAPLRLASPQHCIAACMAGDARQPSAIVILDSSGRLVDHLLLSFFKIVIRSNVNSVADTHGAGQRHGDVQKLRQLLERYEPSWLVVGASPPLRDTRTFMGELRRAVVGAVSSCRIEYLDARIANVCGSAPHYEHELPDHTSLTRATVSLGRCLLDPLAQIAALGANDLLLALPLHPLQSTISRQSLYRALERVLVSTVSHAGVDLNACVQLPHVKGATLEYVCGLGPRKARHVLQKLRQRGIPLRSRAELCAPPLSLMDGVVFRNCAAFLRIVSDDERASPLDDTRIHPEAYYLADRVIVNAMESEDDIRHALLLALRRGENQHRLEELDLDAYAHAMEQSGEGKRHATLQLIKRELKQGFREENRRAFSGYDAPTLFNLLTGEVLGRTLVPGQKLHVRVQRIARGGSGVAVRVDDVAGGDLAAFIRFDDVSDSLPSGRVDDREALLVELGIEPGSTLTCRLLGVQPEAFRIELASRLSIVDDLSFEAAPPCNVDRRFFQVPPHDREWLLATIDHDRIGGDLNKLNNKSLLSSLHDRTLDPRLQRNINHPNFANCSRIEAEERLSSRPAGECVFRPSKLGLDRLVCTYKVNDVPQFAHIEVMESDKPNDVQRALGRSLSALGHVYEDLDELLVNGIRRLADHARRAEHHRKFRFGSTSVVDSTLRDDKEYEPNKVPYCVSWHETEPGALSLALCTGADASSIRVRRETIRILPEGLKFRRQSKPYRDLDALFRYWKQFPDPSKTVQTRENGSMKTKSRSNPPSESSKSRSTREDRGQSVHYADRPSLSSSSHYDDSRRVPVQAVHPVPIVTHAAPKPFVHPARMQQVQHGVASRSSGRVSRWDQSQS